MNGTAPQFDVDTRASLLDTSREQLMLFVTKKASDHGQAAPANQAAVEGDGFMQPGKEPERYAFQSWGAPCVEVKLDPEIARVTVSRVVSAFDVGRIVNRKTAQSQGIIMDAGMALMGTPYMTIATAASSPVTWLVNADIHSIEVHFIEKQDSQMEARGTGEITVTGVARRLATRSTMPPVDEYAHYRSRQTSCFRAPPRLISGDVSEARTLPPKRIAVATRRARTQVLQAVYYTS